MAAAHVGAVNATDPTPLITNDAVVLGLLVGLLAFVFHTSSSAHPGWRRFYKYVPPLLLCYFLPAVFNTLGIINGDQSQIYHVTSRYLLPACLVLLTLSTDIPGILRLGPKALIMFLTGTVGVVIGGPIALFAVGAVSPETVGGEGADAVWRGFATLAGSWTGGGANMAALKEIFGASDSLFGMMVAVDVFVANLWLALLLYLAGRSREIDRRSGADTTAIDALRESMETFALQSARPATLRDIIFIAAAGFGFTGLAHLVADWVAPWLEEVAPYLVPLNLTSTFFWIVLLATTAGVLLSFSPVRKLEGAGASKVGSALLYLLIASIGMKMDIAAVWRSPGLFAVGAIWISIHGLLLLIVGRLIRAPVFFFAVGSQANIGAAASAPVVASAFHPALAPVGVLLAVLGYTVGTYAGWICGQLLRLVSLGG